MIIVFEGIDGSGKSTLLENTYEHLKKDHSVYKFKFPTKNNQISTLIYDTLNGNLNLTYESLAILFEIDRYLGKDILLDLNSRYEYVLLDRYYLSNLALQGARCMLENGDIHEFISKFVYIVKTLNLVQPDMTFICDTSLNVTTKNLSNKQRDILESDINIQKNAQYIYNEILPQYFTNLIYLKMSDDSEFYDPDILCTSVINLIQENTKLLNKGDLI